jgi:hypothetical protein
VTKQRDGERGLTIIEAIVVTTITALLALLILPVLTRGAANSSQIAERAVDTVDAMRAEREFRTLVRAVSRRERDGQPEPVIIGSATQIVLQSSLPAIASCADAGAPVVALSIDASGLQCVSGRREREILAWTDDAVGAFAYSADGVVWQATWRDANIAPLVRFELRQGARARVVWIERASNGAP